MNNSQVAKNGFKTFIVTLVVSLVVFSALYYFLAGPTKDINIEKQDLQVSKTSAVASVAAANDTTTPTSAAPTSAFAELSKQRVDSNGKMVLAATTESTSTVPNTGVTEITWGVVLSILSLGFGAYLVYLGPRKRALAQFEKDVTRDLD